MREYSTPATVEIPQSARLTDVVFERAAREPATVIMRRRDPGAGGGGWQDVTARQFAHDVMALAKGLMAAGIAAGDRVALMSRQEPLAGAGASTVPALDRITTAAGLRAARSKTTSVRVAEAGISTAAGVLYSRISPPEPGGRLSLALVPG